MKIGIIGLGNMGGAILSGLLKEKKFELFVNSLPVEETKQAATELGVNYSETATELIEQVDVCILAVKPNIYSIVFAEIHEALVKKEVLLISIAAGITLEKVRELTHDSQKIVRVMPNMAAKIGKSCTAITKNERVTEDEFIQAKEILSAIGQAYEMDEKDFSTFIGISGSSPAYIYMFIDAMSRAAVKHGMPKQQALEIVTNTMIASSELLLESKENPWELIDKISSPGGTTVAGVLALEEAGFVADVVKGIDATIAKDISMQSK